jgi:hypothetical protein
MKHIKKFFESFQETSKDEIMDSLLSINDELGEPDISQIKYGELNKWKISWDLNLNLSHLQSLSDVSSKIKNLSEFMVDIESAASRLEDYDFSISLSKELIIELTPKETGNEKYEFIKGYDFRVLNIIKSEIERFFRSKGIKISNWEETHDEGNETGDVIFTLSGDRDVSAINSFITMFNQEIERKSEDIHREYMCHYSGNDVIIYPTEEKAYVQLV